MRGFPLLSTLLIAAGFAVAWWPLQRSMEVAEAASDTTQQSDPTATITVFSESNDAAVVESYEVRIYASSPWQSLRIESLGEVIVENFDATEIGVPDLSLPSDPQGFDLWIDAAFADDTGRIALGIEVENSFGEVIQRTLWSEGGAIADSVFFQVQAE